jgi:hypothetical protein
MFYEISEMSQKHFSVLNRRRKIRGHCGLFIVGRSIDIQATIKDRVVRNKEDAQIPS